MKWRPKDAGKAVDLAAAGIFAGATGFAATALSGALVAMLAAPVAFVLAFCLLRRVDTDRRHGLPHFALAPVDPPSDSADERSDDTVVGLFDPRHGRVPPDAGQALSDALAQLKRSLR